MKRSRRFARRSPLRFRVASRVVLLGLFGALATIPGDRAETREAKSLTLAEAIRYAYEHSPAILKARQGVHLAEGQLAQTRGQFDMQLQVGPSIQQNVTVISDANASQQNENRVGYDNLASAFKQLEAQLQAAISSGSTALPVCPPELSHSTLEVNGVPLTICQQPDNYGVPLSQLQNLALIYFSPTPALADLSQFQAELAKIMALNVQTFSEGLTQQGEERILQNLALATQWANLATLDRERLGDMPTYQYARTAQMNFSLSKPLRTGTLLQLTANFEGLEQNFQGKLLDPAFGGEGVQTAFTSGINLVWNQPLLRGRGRIATDAPELAAEQNLKSAQETYLHTIASQAQSIALAYFDLALAQESLLLLEGSVANQQKLLDAMHSLKKAGDISRSDVTRVEARLGDVQTQAAAGRISVLTAQAALALDIGWGAADPPIVASERPSPEIELPLEGLEQKALTIRHDLQAARDSLESARILRDAALANTKPQLNLSVMVGNNTAYYSPYFRALDDEFFLTHEPGMPLTLNSFGTAPPTAPIDTGDQKPPLSYFNPVGIYRALTRHPNPGVQIQMSFQLPFKNNTQRGQLAQAEASVRSNSVMTEDLARVITHNVNQTASEIERTRKQLERWQEASKQQEATWNTSQQLRAAGELSIIDVLVTEQDLTSTRLQLAQAKHDLATEAVQLRFESGSLVPFDGEIPKDPNIKDLVIGQ